MGSKQAKNENLLCVLVMLGVQEAPAEWNVGVLKVKSQSSIMAKGIVLALYVKTDDTS